MGKIILFKQKNSDYWKTLDRVGNVVVFSLTRRDLKVIPNAKTDNKSVDQIKDLIAAESSEINLLKPRLKKTITKVKFADKPNINYSYF